jgi:hypothetical protein
MTDANNVELYQAIQKEFQELYALTINYPKDGKKDPCSFTQVADMVVIHLDTTPESHFVDSGFNAIKEFKKVLSDVSLPKTDIKEEYSYIPAGFHHPMSIEPTISREMPKASVHGRAIKNVKSDMTLTLSFAPESLDLIARAHRLALYRKAHAKLTAVHQEVAQLVGTLPKEERCAFMKNILNAQGLGRLRDLGMR